MSLSVCKENETKYAFNMSDDDWTSLKKDKSISITMPCCGKKAACKENNKNIRYFDHVGERCRSHIDVSTDGMIIKMAIINLLKQRGWVVETEKAIGKVVADIYAENSKHKMCIQVQMGTPSVEQIERKDKELRKHDIKPLWLVKFAEVNLKKNISLYNNRANVLAIVKKQGEIMIGGFFTIESQAKSNHLSSVRYVKLSDFINLFFIDRKIQRHQLDKNLLINFDYVHTTCSKCKSSIAAALHVNLAFNICNAPIQFSRVWFEDINDKVVFTYINEYSRENFLGFGVSWVEVFTYDDEDEVAVQYCLGCMNAYKIKKEARNITNTKKSSFRSNTRLIYTDFGIKFGAIWILNSNS